VLLPSARRDFNGRKRVLKRRKRGECQPDTNARSSQNSRRLQPNRGFCSQHSVAAPSLPNKKPPERGFCGVERTGIEPVTSGLQSERRVCKQMHIPADHAGHARELGLRGTELVGVFGPQVRPRSSGRWPQLITAWSPGPGCGLPRDRRQLDLTTTRSGTTSSTRSEPSECSPVAAALLRAAHLPIGTEEDANVAGRAQTAEFGSTMHSRGVSSAGRAPDSELQRFPFRRSLDLIPLGVSEVVVRFGM
jgi:hypothetical protein